MEKIELTCIGCPLGCSITVTRNRDSIVDITGFTCKRGQEYARTEVLAPVRTITSTVRVEGGLKKVVPVKTAQPIPKAKIGECMQAIYGISIKSPVAIGQLVCDNLCGTGVALVATATA